MAASNSMTTFQQIAIPRLRMGLFLGGIVGAALDLAFDPTNALAMFYIGSGLLGGMMLGFMASVMTSEGPWQARHPASAGV
jgi:hypothetical protein